MASQVESDAASLQKKAEEFWKEIKDIKIPDVTTGKTTDEIIEDIVEHEKVHTGIDWKAAAAGGPTELKAAADKAHAYLNSLTSKLTPDETKRAIEMGILQPNGEIHPVMAMLDADADSGVAPIPSDAKPFYVWGWDPEKAKEFQDAKGGEIKDLIINLIRNLQIMENDSERFMVQTFIGIGVWGVGYGIAKVWQILRTVRALTEATEAYAILEGIREVGIAVIKLGITIIVFAVLIPIFVLMAKDAAGIMVIINDTDEDQVLEEIACTHGKVVAIFKEKAELKDPQPIIPKKLPPIVNPETHEVVAEGSIQAGLFVARKRDGALIGTQGALKFQATASFPQGAYIGWCVPLAKGKNSLLVSATFDGSASKFSDKTGSGGKQEDTSTSTAKANVTGRVDSGSGSEAYYIMNLQSQ